MLKLQEWACYDIIYTDDCIMVSEKYSTLEGVIVEISKKFEITDEGEVY